MSTFDDLLVREMMVTGCSIGEGLRSIEARDPSALPGWRADKSDGWKTVEGWKKWKDDIVARVEAGRKSCSSGVVPPFHRIIKLYQEEGLTLAGAVRKAVSVFPDSHQNWLQAMHTPAQPAHFRRERISPPPATLTKETTMTGKTFESEIEWLLARGVPRIEAVKQVVREQPELHEQFLHRAQQNRVSIPADHRRAVRR